MLAQVATETGAWIGAHGGQLVYGGGRAGLMGTVADAALASGARVVGVIPRLLVEREQAHRGCHELLVVDSMTERKRRMAERADAFLALPGGIGTFEELFEMWSWRQLGLHQKPIGLLNAGGYYDGLLRFLDGCVRQGLMTPAQTAMVTTATRVDALMPVLARSISVSSARM